MDNKDIVDTSGAPPPVYTPSPGNPASQYPGNIGYPQTQQPPSYPPTTDVITTFSERPVVFHNVGPAPDSLAFSIISLFFCLPFGIVAVIKASEARNRNGAGDFIGAHHASRLARQWAGAAVACGVGFILLYFFILLI